MAVLDGTSEQKAAKGGEVEMIYRITRIDKDGTRTLVGYTEDLCEVGVMIHEDRDKYDTVEDTYEVVQEDA